MTEVLVLGLLSSSAKLSWLPGSRNSTVHKIVWVSSVCCKYTFRILHKQKWLLQLLLLLLLLLLLTTTTTITTSISASTALCSCSKYFRIIIFKFVLRSTSTSSLHSEQSKYDTLKNTPIYIQNFCMRALKTISIFTSITAQCSYSTHSDRTALNWGSGQDMMRNWC